jgi:hypothetical protein
MAEHRTVTATEHRRHPPPLDGQDAMPDGVDAIVQAMQAPGLNSAANLARRQPHL